MVKKLETYRRALIFGTHVLWVDGNGDTKKNECSSKPEFASLKLRRHLVLVYKIHSKTHGILPIKSRFLAIWGVFCNF